MFEKRESAQIRIAVNVEQRSGARTRRRQGLGSAFARRWCARPGHCVAGVQHARRWLMPPWPRAGAYSCGEGFQSSPPRVSWSSEQAPKLRAIGRGP